MKALLEQKNGLARRIFSKAGVDNTRLLEATDQYIKRQPKVLGESAGSILGWDLKALTQRAEDYKKEDGDSFVSVEHLVLGFAQDNRFGKQLFKDFQISLNTLKNAVQAIRGNQNVIDQERTLLQNCVGGFLTLRKSSLQNVKAVFDAAIKVVLQPPKPKRQKKKLKVCHML